MKFEIKASAICLDNGAVVRQGLIDADGDKADQLCKIAKVRPQSVTVLDGKKEAKKVEVKVEAKAEITAEETEETNEVVKKKFKKIRK